MKVSRGEGYGMLLWSLKLKFEGQVEVTRQRTPDVSPGVCEESYGNMQEGKSNLGGRLGVGMHRQLSKKASPGCLSYV